MRVICGVLIVLLVSQGAAKVHIDKCCDAFEMLSRDGRSCVDAPWPQNVTLRHLFRRKNTVVPTEQWMRRWLPPGLSIDSVKYVNLNYSQFLSKTSYMQAVEAAVEYDAHQAEAEGSAYWRSNRVVVTYGLGVYRTIKPSQSFTSPMSYVYSTDYCVDAVQDPTAPFVLLAQTDCSYEDCVTKCCEPGKVVKSEDYGLKCEKDARGYWSPENSSYSKFIPTGVSFDIRRWFCTGFRRLRLPPGDARVAHLVRRNYHDFLTCNWWTCVDYERREDNTLGEVLLYCEESRITRGIYWILRHLCFLSAGLLMFAILSVASNRNMRLKSHGWCLTWHAVCLLGFNLGQVTYYLSLSNEIDTRGYPERKHITNVCFKLALPMYFLLTAANCWLSALCVNMALGFWKLRVALSGNRKDWKKLLVLSAVAWGLPALMTGLCAYVFKLDRHWSGKMDWYIPTLVETRTCFNEYRIGQGFYKYGTTLFYYGPVGVFILVNVISIACTLKKVRWLRRNTSVLRREEDQLHRQREGQDLRAGQPQRKVAARSSLSDAQAIKMYVKMILMTGTLEIVAEVIVWLMSDSDHEDKMSHDHTFSFRSTGYVADFFRAMWVAWLATPEEGYFGAVWSWRGGKKDREGARRTKCCFFGCRGRH